MAQKRSLDDIRSELQNAVESPKIVICWGKSVLLILDLQREGCLPAIGVDLAGILRGTHGERRRWVGVEWGGVW